MQSKSDAQLLREYAEHGAETAFAEIVARHTNLVYSAALRQVDSPDIAAEVAQNAFIALARGAGSLSRKLADNASLAGWLCRSARYISLNFRRDEFRRHSRERQAMEHLDSIPDATPDWERLRPVLDEAMSELSEPDYDALLMRFFKNQDLRSVGLALGVSDDAAQKRVSRALDKLRDLLSQRGISTSATALSITLSANAVQPAPAGLVVTISAAAAPAGTTIASAASVAATKAIAMTALQKTIIGAALVAAVGAGIFEARQNSRLREQNQTLQQQQAPLAEQIQQLRRERDDTMSKLASLRDDNERLSRNTEELLKLRAEAARLRRDSTQMSDPSAQTALAWLAKKEKLQRLFEERPEERIPEMRFLTEKQWLDLAKDLDLDSDEASRFAIHHVRTTAKLTCAPLIRDALQKFADANNGNNPTDVSQLKPFFDPAIEDGILQRYKIMDKDEARSEWLQGMVLVEKTAVDKWQETQVAVGRTNYGFGPTPQPVRLAFPRELKVALESYQARNPQKFPADLSELRPYLTNPEQEAALDKLIKAVESK